MAGEVKITFDTLFSILRNEKSRDEIQELDPSFYDDVIAYLNEKKEMVAKETDGLNVFISSEKERNLKQLSNTKRILNEIYDRREKKIIEMALVKSRTKSDVVSSSGLLGPEANLYESLVELFDSYREGIISNILEGKKVDISAMQPVPITNEEQDKEQKLTKKVRFICETPKFVGENLEVYGPFQQEEIAELPSEIASLLVLKGRAQESS